MPTLADVRQQYPQYADLDDKTLADKLHHKFYSDIPKDQFDQKLGLSKPYEGWGDYTKDVFRTATQGATLGFGDEIIAGTRAAFSDKTYDETLAEERGAVDRFRSQNPTTALGVELVAGFGIPVAGAASLLKGASTLSKAYQGAKIGTGYGAVAGFGAGEGGAANRLRGAGEGAVLGAGIGAALPTAASAIRGASGRVDKAVLEAVDDQEGARLYLADRLRKAGLDEDQIAAELQRGQAAARFSQGAAELPETIADVSPTTQRILRGIKVGGDADELIEPFLGQRQAGELDFRRGGQAGGQFARMNENLRLSMRLSDESIGDKVETLSAKRKKDADDLFSKARESSEDFDLSIPLQQAMLRAMEVPDAAQRSTLMRGISAFTQRGKMGEQGNIQFPVNDIKRLHLAKESLDGLIGEARGYEKRLLVGLKHDLLDEVFQPDGKGRATRNAAYREALDKYASQSELLNAAELGRGFANGTEELTPRMWRALSESEKNMVRRAYSSAKERKLGGKAAGPTTDFTGDFRTANAGEDLRLLLPPKAGASDAFPGGNREQLGELVRREQRISDTSRKVLGNSSTAEKAVDALDVGRMVRVLRYIKDQGGPVQAAVTSLADTLERMSAVKGVRAQYLARNLLQTDPAQQRTFLAQVRKTYGDRQTKEISAAANEWLQQIEISASSYGARAAAEEN